MGRSADVPPRCAWLFVSAALLAFGCGGSDAWWDRDGARGPSFVGGPAPAFAWRTPEGRHAVHVSVPMAIDDCRPLEALGRTCSDLDRDGLTDEWEAALLERLTPVVRLTPDDPFFTDPEAVLVAIGRVHRRDDDVFVTIVLAYTRDYGACGFGAHPGDLERVALRLATPTRHDAVVTAVFLAAHEGGTVYRGAGLDRMRFLEPLEDGRVCNDAHARWIVYASEKKHATYPDAATCEDARDLICLAEVCGAPVVDGAFDFGEPGDVRPQVHNAGEPDAPLLTALDAFGFAGEDAWDDRPFCGGAPRSDACPPSLRSKLLDDPF